MTTKQLVLPALDGVRAIAVLMVLARHCFYLEPTNGLTTVLREFVGMMWLGVDLFFVLSGFLITRLLLAARGQPGAMRQFYGRRLVRIVPAYAVCVLLGVTLMIHPSPLFGSSALRNIDWLINILPWLATFTFNMWLIGLPEDTPDMAGSLGHLWSLAVEEQFYLVWPWLILGLAAAVPRLRRLCLWLILLAFAAKAVFALAHVHPGLSYRFTLSRMDPLLAGAWVAISLYGDRNRLPSTRVIAACGVAGLAGVAFFFTGIYIPLDYWLYLFAPISLSAAIAFAALIALIATGSLASSLDRLLCNPLLRWIGQRSYGIYLLHLPLKDVAGGVIDKLSRAGVMKGALLHRFTYGNALEVLCGSLTLVITFVAAAAMYRWLEKPLLDWNRRRTEKTSLPLQAAA